MKLLLLSLLLFAGCATSRPEQKLVGTMSIYRTNHGFLVVSDQSGESIIVEFNINRVIVKRQEEKND